MGERPRISGTRGPRLVVGREGEYSYRFSGVVRRWFEQKFPQSLVFLAAFRALNEVLFHVLHRFVAGSARKFTFGKLSDMFETLATDILMFLSLADQVEEPGDLLGRKGTWRFHLAKEMRR